MKRLAVIFTLSGVSVLATHAAAQDGAGLVGPPDHTADGMQFAPSLGPQTPEDLAAIDFSQPIENLTEALRRTYWANPAILAERALARGADYRVAQARALYGPSINYELRWAYQRDNFQLPSGAYFDRKGPSRSATAILSQPVYTFGRLAASSRNAQATRDFLNERLRLLEQNLLFDTIVAYVLVLRDREGMRIARENRQLLETELAATEARRSVRESTVADFAQVSSRAAIARSREIEAQARLNASEAVFLSVTGSPAGELAPPNPLPSFASTQGAAHSLAQLKNATVHIAKARERISRAEKDAAFAERLPRIDLRGQASSDSQSPYSNLPRQTSLQGGIVMTGPLFTNGLLAARHREAVAANQADWRLIDDALRQVRSDIDSAWENQLARRQSVEDLSVAVDAADQALAGALAQQRAGFRTTLDVLILARDLLESRNAYNDTLAEAYIAEARLLLAMGVLEMQTLFPSSPSYEQEEHYRRVQRNYGIAGLSEALRTVDSLGYEGNDDRPSRDPSLVSKEGAATLKD